MKVAISAPAGPQSRLAGELAGGAGAGAVELSPAPTEGGWLERLSAALLAGERELEAAEAVAAVVAGTGPDALAAALAASRSGIPVVRLGAGEAPHDPDGARASRMIDAIAAIQIPLGGEQRARLETDRGAPGATALDPDAAGRQLAVILARGAGT